MRPILLLAALAVASLVGVAEAGNHGVLRVRVVGGHQVQQFGYGTLAVTGGSCQAQQFNYGAQAIGGGCYTQSQAFYAQPQSVTYTQPQTVYVQPQQVGYSQPVVVQQQARYYVPRQQVRFVPQQQFFVQRQNLGGGRVVQQQTVQRQGFFGRTRTVTTTTVRR